MGHGHGNTSPSLVQFHSIQQAVTAPWSSSSSKRFKQHSTSHSRHLFTEDGGSYALTTQTRIPAKPSRRTHEPSPQVPRTPSPTSGHSGHKIYLPLDILDAISGHSGQTNFQKVPRSAWEGLCGAGHSGQFLWTFWTNHYFCVRRR